MTLRWNARPAPSTDRLGQDITRDRRELEAAVRQWWPSSVVDVTAFGAPTNGATDARTALAAANARALQTGGAVLLPAGRYRVASNVTMTAPLWLLPGAVLVPDAGVTVTISGGLTAPPQRVFDTSAGGTVQAAGGFLDLNVRWWGATGNGTTDDTDAIEAAIASVDGAAAQGTIWFPRGAYRLTRPVVIGRNVNLAGEGGTDFATRFLIASTWTGTAVFRIEGALTPGGFAFRQRFSRFMVDCTALTTAAALPCVFNIDTAYTITLEDLYVHNGVGVAIIVNDANDVIIDRCKVFGLTATAGVSDCAIDCRGTSSVTIRNVDVEVWLYGIRQQGSSWVTVLSGYAERNIQAIRQEGGSAGALTVVGGTWKGINSSTFAAVVLGENATFLGGEYDSGTGPNGLATSGTAWRNLTVVGCIGDVQAVPHHNALTVLQDAGDAGLTYTWQQTAPVVRYATTLTANRTVTLSATNARPGAICTVLHDAGFSTFVVNVSGLATVALPWRTWGTFAWDATAGGWRLIARGTLTGTTMQRDGEGPVWLLPTAGSYAQITRANATGMGANNLEFAVVDGSNDDEVVLYGVGAAKLSLRLFDGDLRLGTSVTPTHFVTAAGRGKLGTLELTAATPTVASGEVGLGVTTATTVGGAGTAAALPANPVGYLRVNIGGTAFNVPYYNA